MRVRCGDSGYPAEEGLLIAARCRQPKSLQTVLHDMKNLHISGRLRAVGAEALLETEVIAARLFTGPMHYKYNAVLRGRSGGPGSKMYTTFDALCRSNLYTSSLHALHSAVSKLMRVGTARVVYRAVSSAAVPEWLFQSSIDESSARRPIDTMMGSDGVATTEAPPGGVELGFMSATTDAEQALKCASESALMYGNWLLLQTRCSHA